MDDASSEDQPLLIMILLVGIVPEGQWGVVCIVMLARGLTSEDLGLHNVCSTALRTHPWLCLFGPSSTAGT